MAVKVSAKAEYACLAVIALASRYLLDKPVPIREIAESHGIPETFLTQILIRLKGAGLVTSTRGSSGGYRLARDPGEISLGDVLRVIDGGDHSARAPRRASAVVLSQLWEQIQASQVHILNHTSIAQLAEQSKTPDWTI
ncbi:RrF2 family transcriptional regulator [Paludisphaera borealis]|uniref:RrF2 family transcriptional regulator n=1 Tax=Paludisphaera borealis TaxID=1387353 RepID=UPI00097052B3|nr:Rrf2 family transcriptional regulator [Paludisphaera borealis]